ncbi:hypothetical protein SDRG_09523 [Saprolegnia diclina VS20]|uniref:OTU domain-containing protein n=1 Tax=Saprolegnia diclina (strain VS20) TaxID=1156394 RepID=T0QE54_SAPDV|nr:hypothetical protein SDRG_09523 [Saprolegnia diclina VS20]EQC33001.1 hypothetical protein SDRG_09523 [Saprolegnia diclina VS20]|eukprot:XP_008613687.1 hypothetical protein SDRG_09523 [Saprolegnia diclina VS20]
MASRNETEGQAKQRHKLEAREWQNQTKLLQKKWKKEKKSKKDVEDELVRLEHEMKERHAAELLAFAKDDDDNDETVVDATPPAADPTSASTNAKLEKAQRKREKKKQEEKDRQLRIAEESKNVVSERKVELDQIALQLQSLSMTIHEIPSDGHCLYHAVADQLRRIEQLPSTGALPPHLYLRQRTAASLRANADDYMPFVELNYEADESLQDQFAAYCHRVEHSSDWGGQIELRALAQSLQRPIHVYAAGSDVLVMGDDFSAAPLRVSYHLHYYTLGAHYNSVATADADDL